jgi:2-C-methyl-D-erythritol 2,4-cyclodiphosphate synthase
MSDAPSAPRVGLGFDVHAFAPDRPLWLGGVHFAQESGLRGHSDGDVVSHAVADALLGAAALGDVGMHFPDSDSATEGMQGLTLLAKTMNLVASMGLPSSVDVTVICERPAIDPRRHEMQESLAATLRIDATHVSVKATRPEGLGLTGDGIGCMAVVVLA